MRGSVYSIHSRRCFKRNTSAAKEITEHLLMKESYMNAVCFIEAVSHVKTEESVALM